MAIEDIVIYEDEDAIDEVDDVAPFEDDAYASQFDDDPNPYEGTYSEE